jgi:hypothetical protein
MDQISQIQEQWGQTVGVTEEAIAAITSQKIEAGDLIDVKNPLYE